MTLFCQDNILSTIHPTLALRKNSFKKQALGAVREIRAARCRHPARSGRFATSEMRTPTVPPTSRAPEMLAPPIRRRDHVYSSPAGVAPGRVTLMFRYRGHSHQQPNARVQRDLDPANRTRERAASSCCRSHTRAPEAGRARGSNHRDRHDKMMSAPAAPSRLTEYATMREVETASAFESRSEPGRGRCSQMTTRGCRSERDKYTVKTRRHPDHEPNRSRGWGKPAAKRTPLRGPAKVRRNRGSMPRDYDQVSPIAMRPPRQDARDQC